MSAKKSRLMPLAARKRLLLMESDLNRVQLIETLHEWKQEFHRSTQPLHHLGSLASLAGKAAVTIPAIGRMFFHRHSPGKKNGLPGILRGMLTGTSLWLLLRSFRRKP